MVARFYQRDSVTDRLDNSGSFVTQHGRQRRLEQSGDNVIATVANARRRHLTRTSPSFGASISISSTMTEWFGSYRTAAFMLTPLGF